MDSSLLRLEEMGAYVPLIEWSHCPGYIAEYSNTTSSDFHISTQETSTCLRQLNFKRIVKANPIKKVAGEITIDGFFA